MSKPIEIRALKDERDTRHLGAELAALARPGDIFCLSGDLGAGKTTLSRGFVTALLGECEVPSPTYTLVQVYDAPNFQIYHFDLYRIKSPTEVWELGIDDAFYDGVSLVEWPERLEDMRPDNTVNIHIGFDGEARSASLSYPQSWQDRL